MPVKAAKGVVRPLDVSDPRNPDHPSHTRQWLELAAALGRMMADIEYDRLHKGVENENGSTLRKVLE